MGKQFSGIEPAQREFIARQRIFFTASAAAGARVNISPPAPTRCACSMPIASPISTSPAAATRRRRICGPTGA